MTHAHTGVCGKPVLRVDGSGDGFAAGGDGLRGPIGVADDEARPRRDVKISIDAEGARGRMRDCHLGEAVHEQQRDDRGEDVAEDDAGSSGADGEGAAEKESGADCAADGDHAELAFAELAREALLVGDCLLGLDRKRDGFGGHQTVTLA